MTTHHGTLDSITLPGMDPGRPTVIAGPCSAETERQVLRTARELASRNVRIFRAGLWKPRTKPGGFEGVGAAGLAWLKRVKRETGLYVATEVASREHVFEALDAEIDLLWIGARTTVNPFAVQEIADALRGADLPVLVKNPVNPDLELWIGAIERLHGAGVRRLAAVHRGFCSHKKEAYRNIPLWHIPVELRRRMPNLPIFCDPSHIAGRRELIGPLAREAVELNFDGLLVETHCDPDTAWSDARQQITPEELGALLDILMTRQADRPSNGLEELRCRIDHIDEQLLELLACRMRISTEIGIYKKEHDMPALQASRYGEVLERRTEWAREMDLNPEFVLDLLREIHEESVRCQLSVMS